MNCVSHKQDSSSCVWALALHLNTTTCEKARSNLDPRRRRKGERPWDRGWVKTRKKWPAVRSRAVRHQIPSACRFKSNGKQKSGTFKNCNQHVQGTSIFSDSCCVSTTSAAVHLCPEGIFFFFAKHKKRIVCCIQSVQSEEISLDPLNYISTTLLRVISDISKFNLTPWRLEYVKINHTLKLGNGIKKQFTLFPKHQKF